MDFNEILVNSIELCGYNKQLDLFRKFFPITVPYATFINYIHKFVFVCISVLSLGENDVLCENNNFCQNIT